MILVKRSLTKYIYKTGMLYISLHAFNATLHYYNDSNFYVLVAMLTDRTGIYPECICIKQTALKDYLKLFRYFVSFKLSENACIKINGSS